MSVTLLYFPTTKMQGDIDNIVKPILGALCRHVYHDDGQVERVWVQKFEPDSVVPFGNPTQILADALQGARPLLFIRLSADPNEGP